ncbi:hypothetical protein L596_015217 [Steinernema carpocapsae]|uniref:TATA box-binding protein-associated factor RNA polymerase I subunit B n=1 Tax=Steinernema carpocapsae TaxID=34508 RepID=A0A4U5NEX1_STECR|nr:hypothetical protein L596_015217 [Steinernema carpocapsae]
MDSQVKETCPVCRASEFELVEGFYYCQTCGTQSQTQREYDIDEAMDGNAGLYSRTTRVKKPKEKQLESESKNKDRLLTKEEYLQRRAQRGMEFPKYLLQCGYRLATFAKLLHRYAEILIRDFDVDESVLIKVRFMLQEYLRIAGVAFTDSELAQNEDEALSVMDKKLKPEIKKELSENRRNMKNRKIQQEKDAEKKKKFMSAGEALGNIFGDEDDEEVKKLREVETEDAKDALNDTMFQVNVVRIIKTKISQKAVIAAGNLFMDIDLILAMLYVACITSGATWILLSDITRWYREGRFPITQDQLNAVTFAVGMESMSDTNMEASARRRVRGTNYAAQPLFQSYRVFHAAVQMVGLPREISVKPEFEQILLRFVYNLNLPYLFMDRLKALLKLLPIHCERSLVQSEAESPLDSARMREMIQNPIKDVYGSVSFFNLFFDTCKVPCRDQFRRMHNQSFIMSDEVKAAALILFALKLMFGLDDSREFAFKSSNGANPTENLNFGRFLLQLRLRMEVWKGKTVAEVLSKGYTPKSQTATASVPSYVSDMRFREELTEICSRQNDFRGCVPSIDSLSGRTKALFRHFEGDVQDQISRHFHEKDALYTPLRQTVVTNKNVITEIPSEALDSDNVTVFSECYSKASLEYDEPEEAVAVPYKSREENDSRCSSEEKRQKWKALFPLSSGYQVYPRIQRLGSIATTEATAVRGLFDEGELVPVLICGDSEIMFETAKPCFSQSFSFLLKQLSLIIGEMEHIVYFTLLMLEVMLFEKTKHAAFEESLLKGNPMDVKVGRNVVEVFLADQSDIPRWQRRYAISNDGKGIELSRSSERAHCSLPLNEAIPLLFWKYW